MFEDENRVKRKVQLKRVAVKRQESSLSKEVVDQAEAAVAADTKSDEAKLSADHLAILFICQRGHQSFISILQGVNSTRVPVGLSPLKEDDVRALLDELESEDYLKKAEMQDQPTWTATEKARALET